VKLLVYCRDYCRSITSGEGSRGANRGLDVRYHQRCGEPFSRRVSYSQRQTIMRQWSKVVKVSTQRPHLPATRAVIQRIHYWSGALHKPFLHIASRSPVAANIQNYRISRHFCTFVGKSILAARIRHQAGNDFC
jgi:hypothetical protein